MSHDHQRKPAGTIRANDITVQRQILAGHPDGQQHGRADQTGQESTVFGMRDSGERQKQRYQDSHVTLQ
jgi:hypothetical protein